ncbi:bifunctional chorismate mutase/prephenate dehydrogenase [Myxosarcina sp. GI1]|uniref:bifunctional chorismate mutase/prephenate dehydrogenase n=1 Tax=Myxosarcina sp. GI1 TaxID=1541065 RepID=UPI0005675126|nr:bifunctional chorismate mutase/prephenate dehydrogenase [Myxosarcina sp. GI1]
MSETLEQIDRKLIELLGKRISCLSRSQQNDCGNRVEIASLLARSGIPEFVWQNLTINCAAASTATSSSLPIKQRRVTVIGGGGQMGRFFVEQLSSSGHHVDILGRHDWGNARQLLGKADLVIVSVPIEQTVSIIEQTARYLNNSTVLADVTSIKTPIVQAMLDRHPGPVLGLHPMFGPRTDSFLSQNVVVCPSRQQQAYQWFLDFIVNRGGKLIWCTPQEHDRMMAIVQAVRHFSTFSLGAFLAEEGIDLSRTLKFASPLYRMQLDLVGRLFTQDASLYLNVMLPGERPQVINRLAATYNRLAELVEKSDRAALTREFEVACSFFEQETCRALEESNYMIDSLSRLLAANETVAKADKALLDERNSIFPAAS